MTKPNNVAQFIPARRSPDALEASHTPATLPPAQAKPEFDVERCLDYMRSKSSTLAQAKADRVYLSEFRKSKKAMLMCEAESKGISVVAKQETYAYAHTEYQQLLDGLRVAIEKEAHINLQIETVRLRIELYRTEQANLRAERSAYNA